MRMVTSECISRHLNVQRRTNHPTCPDSVDERLLSSDHGCHAPRRRLKDDKASFATIIYPYNSLLPFFVRPWPLPIRAGPAGLGSRRSSAWRLGLVSWG